MKNLLALICLVSVIFLTAGCDSIVEPGGPPYEFQAMYERTYPIINPDEKDVDTECATMINTAGGGQNSGNFRKEGDNRWIATFPAAWDDGQQYVFLLDKKVVPLVTGECIPATARNLYMRGTGQDWVFLARVEPAQICGGGEWAVIYLRKGKVEVSNMGW